VDPTVNKVEKLWEELNKFRRATDMMLVAMAK
jgi:hypothetical protein